MRNTPYNNFLKTKVAQGGKNGYVALLLLAANEANKKHLLKRVNMSFVQSNYNHQQMVNQNQAS